MPGVRVCIPDAFEAHNNRMLADAARHGSNIIFLDWHAASVDRPELFWNDGEHLRPNGADFYAALIAQALRDAGVP